MLNEHVVVEVNIGGRLKVVNKLGNYPFRTAATQIPLKFVYMQVNKENKYIGLNYHKSI